MARGRSRWGRGFTAAEGVSAAAFVLAVATSVVTVLVIGFFVILWDKILQIVLPLLFTLYLLYGFVRPHISRRMRHEIEEEDEEESLPLN